MENITLSFCNFIKLLPQWMREDKTDASLAESIDIIMPDISRKISLLSRWDQIDNMEDAELDKFAWELNISWYQYSASLSQKCSIIKNAKKIHRKLGTKWAVEQVLSIYFDESKVVEWYEYGGEPGHFKIQTYNTATVDQDAERFLKILNDVKRIGVILDDIEVLSSSTMDVKYCIRPRSVEIITSIIKD